MVPIKEVAPIRRNPIDAKTRLSIQSKAEFKYTHYLGYLISQNFEILFFAGVEAVNL